MGKTKHETIDNIGKLYNEIYKKVGAEGFPKEPLVAFFTSCDDEKEPYRQIIMSRVPGGATTNLIAQGYDTKGFLIKTKSCDWGPMAGFVCKLPPLNKAGYDNLKSNYKSTKKFWDTCQKEKKKTDPFRQIKITKSRIGELKKQSFFNKVDLKETRTVSWGVASNKKDINESTVIIEFLLYKDRLEKTNDVDIYKVYHGKIFIRETTTSKWIDYEGFIKGTTKPDFLMDTKIYEYGDKLNTTMEKIDVKDEELKQTIIKPSKDFYELQGICNLYKEKEDKEQTYQSTVTGDYDLFAVWPVFEKRIDERHHILDTRQLLLRLSEVKCCNKINEDKKLKDAIIQNVFSSFINYNDSLPVVIQFIPHTTQMKDGELESEEMGNYNNIGIKCIDKINRDVQAENKPMKFKRAHHSDEGGRPEINLLDLPVLVSMPNSYAERVNFIDNLFSESEVKMGIYIIDSIGKFLKFCNGLQNEFKSDINSNTETILKCPLVLNHAWLLNLIAFVYTDTDLINLITNDEKLSFIKKDKADKGEIFDEYDKFCENVQKQRIQDQNNTPPTQFDLDNLKDVFFPFLNDSDKEDFFNKLLVILIAYTFNKNKSAIDVKKEFDDLYFDITDVRL